MKNEYLYEQYTGSYLGLRRVVGWIGMLLPFGLILGNYLIFNEDLIMRSISLYYHSEMGSVFVGALCAVAIFMFFYSGFGKLDHFMGVLVGSLSLGVAFFPTTLSGKSDLAGMLHDICAASLFLVLAGFSLFRFPKKRPGVERQLTDTIQVTCGLVMVGCVIATAIYYLFLKVEGSETCFVFITESIALISFGISWFTEGLDLKREIT